MMGSSAVLEFKEVNKRFSTPSGPIEVLHRVSLSISEGEFIALTGPSGSGKSTLLHLSALLDQPTSGSVVFDGQEVSELKEKDLCRLRKQKVGMVFQKYYLLPHRSVFENVLFRFRYLDTDQGEAETLARQALDSVGLVAVSDRPARLLSGGEMQRVAVARAMVLKPRLLIADEPTGNLDRASTQEVMSCFRKLNQGGLTIFMVTHNLSLLEFCSRHLVCQDGKIQDQGV
jgi:putative ABC transport system ATP-binding protein